MYRHLFTILASTAVLTAQEPQRIPITPPSPDAPAPIESVVPGANAEAAPNAANLQVPNPALSAVALPDPNQVIRENIIYPKLTGDELADLYFKYTGRRVTVSVEASTAEIRFIQQAPLTYGLAAQLLKKAALLQGFIFVPDVNLANHDVLVLATSGSNHLGQGPEVIIDPADLPEDDRVVSFVMNLQHIKPDEIVRTFTTIVGQLGAYGAITPVPNAGSVVITEKTSLIRRLIQLKEEIDVTGQVATRFIEVQFADVEELAETLNEVLGTQQQSQRSAGLQRVGNNANPAPNAAGLPGSAPATATGTGGGNAAEDVPIQIVPDTRTNRIFVMGRPVDIVFIEGLVAEFDTRTDARNYLRRKLSFIPVAEFLDVAEPALLRAFSGTGDGTSGAGGGRSTGANFGGNTGSTRNSGGNTRTNNTSFGNNSSTGGGAGFGSASSGVGVSLGDPQVNSAPEARLVGRTLLVADNITNSLVVQGPPASVEIITNLLDQIDVKADQVMISAVFGQLALGNDFAFGVDYLRTLDSSDNGATAGRGGSGGFPVLPIDGTAFDPGSLASAAGLGLYGRIGDNFNVLVTALQADSNFKVLSRPTIFTANNQKGTISAGQRIAVPTSSNNFGVGNGGISTNIEYQDVLLSLEVIPLVNSDDEVTLQIALLNDEVIGSQFIEGVGEIPTIGRREVLTTVTIPNGATIALGGLITSKTTNSVSGIPLLSDIPGLGKLFSTTSTEDERAELMIFIQPKIVKSAASLYDAQTDFDSRYDVAQEAHEFSNGPALLPDAGAVSQQVIDGEGGGYNEPIPAVIEEDSRKSTRRFVGGRPGSTFRGR
ncbi:secretin N-terminal domain-containing protein [Haloferula chungangensis]|uniref:Secretin N-terminal domain-containing protein n=1 Tax=Haloferula chungangensis TaxID=1048331 RepID=A0ABW2L435_9BACT